MNQQSRASTSSIAAQPINPQPSTSGSGSTWAQQIDFPKQTAQSEFTNAINFTEETPLNSLANGEQTPSKLKTMMANVMKNINDSKYIYPGISITVMLILVVILIFQTVSVFSKVLALIIFVLFLIFTAYYAKKVK